MADDDTNNDPQLPNIKSLREAADRGNQAVQEAAQLRRENLFLRAGIDIESKVGGMLFKTWEGEDLEALKAEATEIGLLGNTTPQPPQNEDVRGQQDFRRGLAAGEPPAAYEPPAADPRDEAIKNFHEAVRRGVPTEEAQLAAFDRLWTAGVAGDDRVVFDADRWQDSFRN